MWTCDECSIVREKPEKRLPGGWKRIEDRAYCSDCWRKRFILRAITVPVVSPLDCDWKTLDATLAEAWAACTQASNYIVTELYARDVRRADEDKMPPMQPVYLYPELRKRYPKLPSGTVSALEHAVQRKYRARRYETIWTCKSTLPTFRYPTPFPVRSQDWSIVFEDDRPVVSLRVADKRIRLRLHGGWRYARQRKAMLSMATGEAVTGEMAVLRRDKEILVKLVAWLPRRSSAANRSGVLRVRTASESLIVAVNDKDETLWRYNGDHLKRWIAEHRDRLQRLSEDQKYENRPVPSFTSRRSGYADKFRNRMESACHEIAAQLANYAARRKFASVLYDDSERGFVPQFPYYQLSSMMQMKLDELGIDFALASAEMQADVADSLAKELI